MRNKASTTAVNPHSGPSFLELFRQFVSAIPTTPLEDEKLKAEFSHSVSELWAKCPSIAHLVAANRPPPRRKPTAVLVDLPRSESSLSSLGSLSPSLDDAWQCPVSHFRHDTPQYEAGESDSHSVREIDQKADQVILWQSSEQPTTASPPRTEEVSVARSVTPSSQSDKEVFETYSIAKAACISIKDMATAEVPDCLYTSILGTLSGSNLLQSEPSSSNRSSTSPNDWPRDTWDRLIRVCESRSQRSKILSMIVNMGLANWYEYRTTQKDEGISSGTSRKRALSKVFLSEFDERTVKVIQKRVSKGRIASSIVEHTGLGILFYPKIWDIIKSAADRREAFIDTVRSDHGFQQLLEALSEQILMLINEGKPDISRLLETLREGGILSLTQLTEISAISGVGQDPIATGLLQTTYEEFQQDLDSIMQHHGCESVMVGDVEVTKDDLQTLSPQGWLSFAVIASILEATEALPTVDEFKAFGFKFITAPAPLQGDAWTCGDRVIHSARLRMAGLEVAERTAKLDPERLRYETIHHFRKFRSMGLLEAKDTEKLRELRSSKRRKADTF
ncbi:hypothetical protein JX265_013711 [Neoarthrinium moseri]|uniref:Uncharacterized protein n=1 Tax=Neoarthrinium moseri TaxID=1658444 RepID=A0A9P9W843_9PEZI|nr:hypothetical protein JX265_013711 [Neoarthrinium moseri]